MTKYETTSDRKAKVSAAGGFNVNLKWTITSLFTFDCIQNY